MIAKRHCLKFKSTRTEIEISEDDLDSVEEQIKEIRARAEAEKPKDGDIRRFPNTGNVYVRAKERWYTPHHCSLHDEQVAGAQYLGNLTEIAEQQGPIVVGRTVKQAQGIIGILSQWNMPHRDTDIAEACDALREALRRYKENERS